MCLIWLFKCLFGTVPYCILLGNKVFGAESQLPGTQASLQALCCFHLERKSVLSTSLVFSQHAMSNKLLLNNMSHEQQQ
jgi:hypothetical protein